MCLLRFVRIPFPLVMPKYPRGHSSCRQSVWLREVQPWTVRGVVVVCFCLLELEYAKMVVVVAAAVELALVVAASMVAGEEAEEAMIETMNNTHQQKVPN